MNDQIQSACRVVLLLFVQLFVGIACCNQRHFGEDSFVCVCDIESCDSFPKVIYPEQGFYGVWTSSRDEFRYNLNTSLLDRQNASLDGAFAKILINSSDIRQTIFGFGGAFTDSTGINVAKLPKSLQETFIRQYYSPDGLEYNVGRIPIAGSDFSTHPYSYDDVDGDIELLNFNLTEEDYLYKIPLIKKAQELSERGLHLFASPWSPPTWMKTNGMFNGTGELLPEMQQPWANYFVKFIEAYASEGIDLWALTVQNEPSMGGTIPHPWNQCHFTGEQQRDFVRDYLGPTLSATGYRPIKLMIGDDSRFIYPRFAETILNDEVCNAFVDGVAVHWYSDPEVPATVLDEVHNQFPDKFLFYTEACVGMLPPQNESVSLGDWNRGERYAADIAENINHWSTGWTDWNMALDPNGGPNWAANFVDSPIIVNEEGTEFYKQPMFYVMGHFSKFVVEGSTCIGTIIELLESSSNGTLPQGNGKLDAASFLSQDGYTISVVVNRNEDEKLIVIEDLSGNSLRHTLPPKSIQTFMYAT